MAVDAPSFKSLSDYCEAVYRAQEHGIVDPRFGEPDEASIVATEENIKRCAELTVEDIEQALEKGGYGWLLTLSP